MITGTLTKNVGDTGYTAAISTMLFDIARISVVRNAFNTADSHPDFHLEVKTPRGRVLRIGSMWSATSEKSGRDYFSLSITDRMGRAWRMNAVRDEDAPAGEWRIVPLIGKRTEGATLTGGIEALDDGNLAGFVGSYDFDMDFTAVENARKSEPTHPDWHIEARSPAGVLIRMGSIWKATSERSGRDYLSIAFSSPHGAMHRANALPRDTAGAYGIVAFSNDLAVAA